MKKIGLIMSFIAILFSATSHASWIEEIIDEINKQSSITNHILSDSVAVQRDILRSQQDIDQLMKQLNSHFMGHSGWGRYPGQDYQSYGNSARHWSNLLQMAEYGRGEGALGQVFSELAQQFPPQQATFNRGVSDLTAQRYYALKSQTVLAVRAASQLDYNRIQDQINYQHQLQQQIDKTKDIKAAMDLSNRLQIENNLILLSVLRQASLTNQQQAITEQASLQSALANAQFLTQP